MSALLRLQTWWMNLPTFHHRMMMRYLVKRDWVVFYLDPRSRNCGNGMCWLALYEAETRRKGER